MSTPKPKFFFSIAQTYTPNRKPAATISATVSSDDLAAAFAQDLDNRAAHRRVVGSDRLLNHLLLAADT
jgi:hypothetical protein